MNICNYFLLIGGLIFTTCICAQQAPLQQDSLPLPLISTEYLNKVSGKAGRLNDKLDKQTTKALQQWQKQEARIKGKLEKTDSAKAATVFGNAKQQYEQLEQKLQNKTSLQQYIPSLDTLNSSLKFLQQNPQLLSMQKKRKKS